jgi:NADH-quinone oxidoreductase subunit M
VGEFLILLGAFKSNMTYAILGATGMVLAAGYMLWMLQRVVFGELTKDENRQLTDINLREKLILVPLVVLVFWIGIYPSTFFKPMERSIHSLLETVQVAQAKNDAPDGTRVELAVDAAESAVTEEGN